MSNDPQGSPGGITVPVLSLFALFALWIIAAALTGDAQVLPSPLSLGAPFLQELRSGALIYHLGQTLIRVVWAFVLAMSLGLALGLLMGRLPQVNRWLDPWLVVFLNLPALVLIVLCYLWIGLTEAAAITAVAINKIPMVTVLIREGARTFDPALDDMSRIFKVPCFTRLRHIIVPQLAPYFAASARTGTALIWKIVLVVEFLGRSNGVGFQIHLYFQLFDVAMVLTYALSFIAVMLTIEFTILQPWERRASRWRRA